ncbi:MAG: hypothetical protein WAL46_01995 [Nitrososphaeraceae archaeon]
MPFDPLIKVRHAKEQGIIPSEIYKVIVDRFHIVEMGIQRIERASGLRYPYYYIDPTLIIAAPSSSADIQYAQFGFLYAQTIPVVKKNNEIDIVVQVTAPLVVYGLLGTIHAILAHEFMHHLELLSRIIKMEVVSDEISASLFENRYLDSGRLIEARFVFRSDGVLRDHITRKFPEGFKDTRLEVKTIKYWMNKGLPSISVSLDSNVTKIPVEAMAKLNVDQGVRDKIFEFESAAIQELKNKK